MTRPIVSCSGSVTYGLGKWLDRQLQPIIKTLPTYLSSSLALKQDLEKLPGLEYNRVSFFTADAVAMYPSIDVNDALLRIRDFLTNLDTEINFNLNAIMQAHLQPKSCNSIKSPQ